MIHHIYNPETDAAMDKLLREFFRKEPSVDEKARLDAEYAARSRHFEAMHGARVR